MLIKKYEPVQVELDGRTFTIKPNTKRNVDRVLAYMERINQLAADAAIKLQSADPERIEEVLKEIDAMEVPTPWEQRIEILKLILEGPIDEIDWDNVPAHQMESIIEFFLPRWAKI